MLSFFVVLLIIVLDQLTKYLAFVHLHLGAPISVIGDFIELTYVENLGAAFGILKGHTWVFLIAAIFFIIAFGWFMFSNKKLKTGEKIGASMVLGGTIGNLIDRIRIKGVIDFIYLRNFSVFNLADCAIIVGFIILVFYMLFSVKQRKEK